jgi:hypothetical protein
LKRAEFEHAVRAAAAVLGVDELLVIGSQALHGSVAGDLPEEALRSVEVDISALEDPEGKKADLMDGAIGEASMLHATFGYYAQGVEPVTAVLPEGWQDRWCGSRQRGLGVWSPGAWTPTTSGSPRWSRGARRTSSLAGRCWNGASWSPRSWWDASSTWTWKSRCVRGSQGGSRHGARRDQSPEPALPSRLPRRGADLRGP